MLTVLTWLWDQPGGRTRYTAGHVNVWAAMVRRHLSIPHNIACVTDRPLGLLDEIDVIDPPGDFVGIETPTWNGRLPNCFRRLAMFRSDAADIFGERFVSMDVDCVIAGSLDHLFDRDDDDLILYRGTNYRRPYNGSMVMMTAGCRPNVYERFSQDEAITAGHRYLGSDQSWISYVLGDREKTWGAEDGVAWWGSQYNNAQYALMFFPGWPKPWHLVGFDQWITENYRGDEGGRCLVLSDGPSVWSDVMNAGAYDAVIALRGPAAYWRGPIREVVDTEAEAISAARVHGFSDLVVCGG